MTRSRFRRLTAILIAAVCAAFLVASLAAAKGTDITIKGSGGYNYHFQPSKLHVSKGSTVHWKWSSDAKHNVTFKSLGKHSATTANGSYHLTFNKPGTYRFLCTIHHFKGKIVVQ
jgi:plastocyanin